MKTFIDTINFGVKNWWVSLLLGLLYILIAICIFLAVFFPTNVVNRSRFIGCDP